jgi:hypothetical protein
MSEHITIHFTAAAERELAKVAKVDPERATIIEQLLEEVEEWVDALYPLGGHQSPGSEAVYRRDPVHWKRRVSIVHVLARY